MLIDNAKIWIRSGKGGDGAVSFRREKFVPAGGPDGGDGGRGGDIIFQVDKGLNTLYDYRHSGRITAGNGGNGGGRRMHGADGADAVLKVPEGTVVRDAESGKVIVDMSGENQRVTVLKGGKGGIGNMHFATPTMQIPRYAKPGQPGIELQVILELKVIADVGLVGYPNVGKSTILSMVSNAKPKIANYHFTTLDPSVGIVDLPGTGGFALADIPGIIEGASEGAGLGLRFLQHLDRTRVLIHVVDAASVEGRDPVEDIRTINEEMQKYNPEILTRPWVIAANKVDAIVPEEGNEDPVERIRRAFAPEGIPVYAVSAAENRGLKELMYGVADILAHTDRKPVVYPTEFIPEALEVKDLPFTVVKEAEHFYRVEGPRIEKMLGYTFLDTEKGFAFFQNFLRQSGVLKELEAQGIEDGDTVAMYGHQFDYYKEG